MCCISFGRISFLLFSLCIGGLIALAILYFERVKLQHGSYLTLFLFLVIMAIGTCTWTLIYYCTGPPIRTSVIQVTPVQHAPHVLHMTPIVCVPKTMEVDVNQSELVCIGTSTGKDCVIVINP